MSANEKQVGGDHYLQTKIQPWDFINDQNLGYFGGNIVNYVCRWARKNNIEDLKKAQHYLEKLIEIEFGDESIQQIREAEQKLIEELKLGHLNPIKLGKNDSIDDSKEAMLNLRKEHSKKLKEIEEKIQDEYPN